MKSVSIVICANYSEILQLGPPLDVKSDLLSLRRLIINTNNDDVLPYE